MATCHFIEHGDNILVLGPPGVGKTHLAVALGLKAIEAGYRVLFTTAANLIATLTRAHAEERLDEKLKVYTVPRLLIIDEVGDRIIATAILDRVLLHAITLNIRGHSYRLKEKLKAGLVRVEEPSTVKEGLKKPRFS